MKKLSAELTLNAAGYKQGINEAKQGTEAYINTAQKTDKEIKDLNRTFRKAQQEAKGLAIAYNQLTAAQKNTAEGRALQKQMQEAIDRAGQLKDTIGDTTQAISAMASDTANLDSFKEGLELGKSAALTAASAIAKLTGDEKSLTEVVTTLTLVENGFNTAIKLQNALQSQSAIMMGIKRVQALAATKAVIAETAATNGATIAQRVFNTVAKANPYVLLATAVIAAGTAIIGFTKYLNKGAEDEEEAAKKAEFAKTKFDALSQSLENDMVSYLKLQAEYKSLKTELEKTEFIEKNKSAFNSLGAEINSVGDADNFLVNNTERVTRAFYIRAKAAAEAALATHQYRIALEEAEKIRQLKPGDTISKSDAKALGLDPKFLERNSLSKFTGFADEFVVTEKAINVAVNNITYNAQKTLKEGITKSVQTMNEAGKLISDAGVKSANTANKNITKEVKNGGGNVVNAQATILDTLEAQVKKYEDALKNIDITAPDAKDTIKKVQDNLKVAQQAVKDYKIAVGLEVKEVEAPKSTLDKLEDDLKDAQTRLKFATDEESVNEIQNEITDLKNKIEAEEIRLKIKVKEPEQQLNTFDWIDLDIKSLEDEYIQMLDNLGGKFPEPNTDAYNELVSILEKINELQDQQAKLQDPIGKAAEEQEKKLSAVRDTVDSVASAFGSLSQISDDETFNIMGVIAQSVANVALSFSKAMKDHKSFTMWDWIAAGAAGMAQLLAMTAQIKSITSGSYATGGIIGGNSYHGDKLIANVNSGEMILNKGQQKRLFDIANGNSMYVPNNSTVQVTGIIRGKDLLLVQKNANTILSKSKQTIMF